MRRFKLLLGIAAALVACVCQAEAAVQEGVHYERLPVPVDTADAGRVEVVEVFSYACIHCYTFEPYIEAWRAKLDDDVAFRRVPAVFSPQWGELARMFYAAEQLGVLEQVHGGIFEALHERGQISLTARSPPAFSPQRPKSTARISKRRSLRSAWKAKCSAPLRPAKPTASPEPPAWWSTASSASTPGWRAAATKRCSKWPTS